MIFFDLLKSIDQGRNYSLAPSITLDGSRAGFMYSRLSSLLVSGLPEDEADWTVCFTFLLNRRQNPLEEFIGAAVSMPAPDHHEIVFGIDPDCV